MTQIKLTNNGGLSFQVTEIKTVLVRKLSLKLAVTI